MYFPLDIIHYSHLESLQLLLGLSLSQLSDGASVRVGGVESAVCRLQLPTVQRRVKSGDLGCNEAL